jgi:hypothetical protein
MSGLNSGQGRCQGTARLLIRPTVSAIELGAGPDIITSAVKAVHHLNRHAPLDDFVAIALTGMRKGREGVLPGHELELIGSRDALTQFLALEGAQLLFRRRMIGTTAVRDLTLTPGTVGAAYVRDRSCEKLNSGWECRAAARAARRGVDFTPKPVPRHVRAEDTALISLGRTPLRIREIVGVVTGGDLIVSTYGLSYGDFPAILPVLPAMAEVADAA